MGAALLGQQWQVRERERDSARGRKGEQNGEREASARAFPVSARHERWRGGEHARA